MPYASSNASCRKPRSFLPEHLPQWRRALLHVVARGRVESSRGRYNPRGVKQKMSGYRARRPVVSRLPAAAGAGGDVDLAAALSRHGLYRTLHGPVGHAENATSGDDVETEPPIPTHVDRFVGLQPRYGVTRLDCRQPVRYQPAAHAPSQRTTRTVPAGVPPERSMGNSRSRSIPVGRQAPGGNTPKAATSVSSRTTCRNDEHGEPGVQKTEADDVRAEPCCCRTPAGARGCRTCRRSVTVSPPVDVAVAHMPFLDWIKGP